MATRLAERQSFRVARIGLLLGLCLAGVQQSHANNIAADRVATIEACQNQNGGLAGQGQVSTAVADCLHDYEETRGHVQEGTALTELNTYKDEQGTESRDYDLVVFGIAAVGTAVGAVVLDKAWQQLV